MNDRRFDAISRDLVAQPSRRRVLLGLLAGALGTVPARAEAGDWCWRNGHFCSHNRHCCSDRCCRSEERRWHCVPPGSACCDGGLCKH